MRTLAAAPVRPSRGILHRDIALSCPTHAGHPKGSAGSKGLRPTAADPRKHPGRGNAQGRGNIHRDSQIFIKINIFSFYSFEVRLTLASLIKADMKSDKEWEIMTHMDRAWSKFIKIGVICL